MSKDTGDSFYFKPKFFIAEIRIIKPAKISLSPGWNTSRKNGTRGLGIQEQ